MLPALTFWTIRCIKPRLSSIIPDVTLSSRITCILKKHVSLPTGPYIRVALAVSRIYHVGRKMNSPSSPQPTFCFVYGPSADPLPAGEITTLALLKALLAAGSASLFLLHVSGINIVMFRKYVRLFVALYKTADALVK